MDRIKAWIALAGAIVTAVLGSGVVPLGEWQTALSFIAAVLTGITAYTVPNAGYVKVPDTPQM